MENKNFKIYKVKISKLYHFVYSLLKIYVSLTNVESDMQDEKESIAHFEEKVLSIYSL